MFPNSSIQTRRIHIHWRRLSLKLAEELQWIQTLLAGWSFIGKAPDSDRDNVDRSLGGICIPHHQSVSDHSGNSPNSCKNKHDQDLLQAPR